MTKLLNIDDLATPPAKQLTLKGKSHDAVELTVQGYIDRVKRAKDMQLDPTDMAGNIENSLNLIIEIFPGVQRDDLRNLTLTQLKVLIEFALAAPEDIAQAGATAVTTMDNASGNAPG